MELLRSIISILISHDMYLQFREDGEVRKPLTNEVILNVRDNATNCRL